MKPEKKMTHVQWVVYDTHKKSQRLYKCQHLGTINADIQNLSFKQMKEYISGGKHTGRKVMVPDLWEFKGLFFCFKEILKLVETGLVF